MKPLVALACCAMAFGCAPPTAECDLGLHVDAAGCAAVHAMARPDTLPAASGNRVADDPRAAELGLRLFFDRRLSSTRTSACGTCHEPSIAFQDGLPQPMALGPVPRNTPSLDDLAFTQWFFWDGRADTLWSQATFPIESPAEMGMTRLGVAHVVDRYYRTEYESLFEPLPDMSTWPEAGMPGQAAYDALPLEVRTSIDEVFANVAKAIEAYERRLVTGPTALDRFLDGENDALSVPQVEGLERFVSLGCADCHAGPTLSDSAFHNVGTSNDTVEGRGRASVYEVVENATFGARGPFFDGDPTTVPPLVRASSDVGAFRTPLLRGVTQTAPYGHDGRWSTLEEALREHAGAADTAVGELDPAWVPQVLDEGDVARLSAFLSALEGARPPLPWSRWPSG